MKNDATIEKQELYKLICLTFDDGPSTHTMDEVMDVLVKYGAKATFFITGNRIDTNTNCQKALKRAVREGHEICNHSWSHQSMGDNSEFTREMILEEINRTQAKVQEVAGVTPKYFRPPNLSVNDLLFTTVEMPFVTMSTNTEDYNATTAQAVYHKAIEGAKDGAIILQHCFEGIELTVEALEMILIWCKDNGYKAVTVSEMFEAKGITPQNGMVYRSSTQIHQKGLYQ